MNNKPGGGPAFACASDNGYQPGMSLRDWFAGQAMNSGDCPFNTHDHPECSAWAYERADAMIEARAK